MKVIDKQTGGLAAVCLTAVALVLLAAGCSSNAPPTSQKTNDNKPAQTNVETGKPTSADNLKQPIAAVAKKCAVPPPELSAATATNAGRMEIKTKPVKIYTSSYAIGQLWVKAREWAPDAKIRGGYHGAGTSFTPTDAAYRLHAGSVRGAEWAWTATFYSPSKKEDVYLGYIEGDAGGSIPQAVQESTFRADEEKPTSIYTNYEDMIDSCVVYELAQANGFDEKENYHIYYTGDTRTATKYPGRKTWIVEERSRTDTDGGKESLGKVVNTYLFDAVTGELLGKFTGRTYTF